MDDDESKDATKVFKIKYQINLLPKVGEHYEYNEDGFMECQCEDISIMALCNDTEELEIFDTEAITSVISYKWDTFGR
jgi:hypothetical protein